MDQETPSLVIPSHKGELHQIDDHLSMIYCRDIDEVNSHLDLLDTSDVFFSYDFYKAVESHVPHGLTFRYVILYEKEELIGFLHFQIKKIDLGESLEAAYDPTAVHSWWQKLTHSVKLFFARRLNYYTLVSGNMLQTGRYGLHLQQGKTLPIDSYHKVLEEVSTALKKEGISISGILMKDFYESQRLEVEKTKALGYNEFSVQPTMLMDIPEDWKTMDDYMGAIKSKYKVRTRRTFKKCESVEKVDLTEEDLLKHQDRTH
ncbi:MAG: hypothetical protein HKN68_02545, partial [Saprospiraceae bacterium]|nr:hypothetical protein [Saprospiraceae bacterium]